VFGASLIEATFEHEEVPEALVAGKILLSDLC
jgi:hypothetical protein